MGNLYVGDIVRPNYAFQDNKTGDKIHNLTGIIKIIQSNLIGVEFNQYIGGHDLQIMADNNPKYMGKSGYCWCLDRRDLELINKIRYIE